MTALLALDGANVRRDRRAGLLVPLGGSDKGVGSLTAAARESRPRGTAMCRSNGERARREATRSRFRGNAVRIERHVAEHFNVERFVDLRLVVGPSPTRTTASTFGTCPRRSSHAARPCRSGSWGRANSSATSRAVERFVRERRGVRRPQSMRTSASSGRVVRAGPTSSRTRSRCFGDGGAASTTAPAQAAGHAPR